MKKSIKALILLSILSVLSGCTKETTTTTTNTTIETTHETEILDITTVENTTTENTIVETSNINDDLFVASNYTGTPYIEINNNIPYFTKSDITTDVFETYSELDELGRCGVAYANICTEIMPTEKRGEIGKIKPSGWHTANYNEYPGLVDGNYLYNRCHLIAYMLAGENANEKNLITGTRYMNVTGMLPFEDKVHDYMEEHSDNHVLYRVTPIFKDNNLVAEGVLMEAYSVEDNGQLQFCVFCYNVQPGIDIDYVTGDNHISDTYQNNQNDPEDTVSTSTYILNTSSKKIHTSDCSAANNIKAKNKETTNKSYDELRSEGYEPCGICHPENN